MTRSLLTLLLLGQFTQIATAQPPGWAEDATEQVQERKIMRGTPHDSSLQGERPVQRHELMKIFERLDLEAQRAQSDFATKGELNTTQDGVTELRVELETLNQRVETLEESADQIEQKDDSIARPRL